MERTTSISMGEPTDFSLSCSVRFRLRLPGYPPMTVHRVVDAQSTSGVVRATVRSDELLPPEDIVSTGVAAPNPLDLLLQLVGASSIGDLVARDRELKKTPDSLRPGA